MRVPKRLLAAPLLVGLSVGLAACGGDDPKAEPTFGLTEVAVDCDAFAETAKRITDAQAELYTGTGGQEAVDDLVEELDALEDGAPKDVRAALSEMAAAFEDARGIVATPDAEAAAKLAEVSEAIAEDGKTITDYVRSQCD